MIDIELKVKNYRCFGDVPVSLRFRDGFTALLGINNSGKSSLLRIPYEIRSLLQIMANNQNNWGDALIRGNSTIRPYDGTRDVVTLLGQLSFDGRPDLGYSKVLLVEGKTELRALMEFLRFYKKEHQVLMIPLHGTDMINGDVEHELASLLRIDGDVQYLIDSERDSENAPLGKSRQAFVDLCHRLGVSGHVLKRRALENYFTDAAVKLEFGSVAAGLGPYDKKGAAQNWPKANNWRAAVQMSKSDIDGTDLGEFLERL